MNNTSELIPCPFCGSGWLYETQRNGYCDETPIMFCNSCKAVVTWEQVEEEGVNDETKAFVREHWNTRAAYEMDDWFYLPKPKEQLIDYTTGFSFDKANLKATASVGVYALEGAIRKWQEEELNKHIVERICEVFKPERTCKPLGTIRYDYEDGYAGTEYETELSCGHKWRDGYGDYPDYCPNCGAHVIKSDQYL